MKLQKRFKLWCKRFNLFMLPWLVNQHRFLSGRWYHSLLVPFIIETVSFLGSSPFLGCFHYFVFISEVGLIFFSYLHDSGRISESKWQDIYIIHWQTEGGKSIKPFLKLDLKRHFETSPLISEIWANMRNQGRTVAMPGRMRWSQIWDSH